MLATLNTNSSPAMPSSFRVFAGWWLAGALMSVAYLFNPDFLPSSLRWQVMIALLVVQSPVLHLLLANSQLKHRACYEPMRCILLCLGMVAFTHVVIAACGGLGFLK